MSSAARLISKLSKKFKREDGQVIIMVGLAAVVMFAMVGLAVDVGRLYIAKAQLSRALDAAALAGVLELPNTANAIQVCEDYLRANEPDVTPECTSTGENLLRAHARKDIETLFIRVVGIETAGVTAKATAGFGVASLDAALVIDSTSSMADTCNGTFNNSGCPIFEAKNAAIAFKDNLLGTNPSGNTSIGVAAFRGCFRRATPTATAPMPNSKSNCVLHDTSGSSQVSTLIYNKATLGTMIGNISAIGGSGTNVCGGLLKGWEVLDGTGNHQAEENNRRYMIVLSDGDNNYNGGYSYQTTLASPHTYSGYSCMPPSSCSNVGGDSSSSTFPCHTGLYIAETTAASDSFAASSSIASDNYGSTSNTITDDVPSACSDATWTHGTGWAAGWTRSATSGADAPVHNNSGAYNTSCHIRLGGATYIQRQFSLASAPGAVLSYWAKLSSGWESGDAATVQISTNGTSWTTLQTRNTGNTSTSYPGSGSPYTIDLDAYAGQSTVYLRFQAATTAASSEWFYFDNIQIATCPNWSNGTGWAAGWTRTGTGNDAPVISSQNTPNDTSCHARMRGTGAVTRTLNFSAVTNASLSLYAKVSGYETGDRLDIEGSTDGTTWSTLGSITSTASTSYTNYTYDLSSLAGASTAYVRLKGGMTAADANDNIWIDTLSISSCGAWNQGTGWAAAWTTTGTGNDAPVLTSLNTPNDSPCHARLRGTGTLTRTINLSSAYEAELSYYAKVSGYETGDNVVVEASLDGSSWTNLRTHTTGTSYANFTSSLNAFAGSSLVYIRFKGGMSAADVSDNFYFDTVVVTVGSTGSSNGYLNGSNPSPACNTTPVPRERQMDLRTYELSKALKDADIEIFTVAFGVCATNSTTYTTAQCDAQIGNTDIDNTGDQRLMKCISGSKPGTNDHYYYAASASALPAIFTQIAKQIAHRLVE